MGWTIGASLGDIKEECLTEEAKEKIRKEEQYELEHSYGSVQDILMALFFMGALISVIGFIILLAFGGK